MTRGLPKPEAYSFTSKPFGAWRLTPSGRPTTVGPFFVLAAALGDGSCESAANRRRVPSITADAAIVELVCIFCKPVYLSLSGSSEDADQFRASARVCDVRNGVTIENREKRVQRLAQHLFQ